MRNNTNNDDYLGEGIPLNDTTRAIVIAVHYAAIPLVTFLFWAFLEKHHIFKKRIWSPFLLVIALTWLLIGPVFEIGNHFYIDNWQLYDPQSDLINGSFNFFNFGAQNILALSLRTRNQKFIRRPSGGGFRLIGDILAIILDPILAVLVIINPVVYGVAGRETANTSLSPLAAIAGLFTLFRVWRNLGPNYYTLCGGIGFFSLAIFGVIFFSVYNSTGVEWIHILIGGSFVSSTIPLGVAFLNIQESSEDEEVLDNSPDVENEAVKDEV